MIHVKKYNEAYLSTLTQHKEIIKNNLYARELEQKYHKINHKSYKKTNPLKESPQEETAVWPIDSSAFTEVLKAKLNSLSDSKQQIPLYKRNTFSDAVSKFTSRLNSEEIRLPKINKNRFWSPPKLNNPNSDFSILNKQKIFGPRIRSIKIKDF